MEGRGQLKSLKLVMMQDNAAAVTLLYAGPGWVTEDEATQDPRQVSEGEI